MFKPVTIFNVRFTCYVVFIVNCIALCSCHTSKMSIDKDGFIQIFNGKNLNNWIGDSTYWRVEDSIFTTPRPFLYDEV